MKRILVIAALVLTPAAYADQTCMVIGNLVQCTSPQPANWASQIQQMNENTSPEADARVALLRQQAELVRLQNELIRQQLAAAAGK